MVRYTFVAVLSFSCLVLASGLDLGKIASGIMNDVATNNKKLLDHIHDSENGVVKAVVNGASSLQKHIEDMAKNLPFIAYEDPDGSGNYVKDDLSADPDTSLPLGEDLLSYFFYDKNNKEIQVCADNITSISFNASAPTILLTHGWMDCYLSEATQSIKDAYLACRDVNVFIVDWSPIAKRNYATAKFGVPKVGTFIGNFLKTLVDKVGLDLDKTGLIGHCLGAHVVGFAGKTLDGCVDHIVGLDPTGPLYLLASEKERLDAKDAKFVLVIHTSAGIMGIPFSIGDADYWPNGGVAGQPGCGADLMGSCSAKRSYQFYKESLHNGGFHAMKCDDYAKFEAGECNKGIIGHMGNDAEDRRPGNFFLKTNDVEPFAIEIKE